MVKSKKMIVIGLSVFFFIAGIIIYFYGLKNGEAIAFVITRPVNESVWSTSKEQINLTMYGICIFGGLWIVISHIIFVLYVYRNYIDFKEVKIKESQIMK